MPRCVCGLLLFSSADEAAADGVPFQGHINLNMNGRCPGCTGLDTVTSVDRAGLVEVNPESIRVEDCTFRMLQPHEIGRAMAFPETYIVLGTSRDKVKQYGNAVTPPVMEMIIKESARTLL